MKNKQAIFAMIIFGFLGVFPLSASYQSSIPHLFIAFRDAVYMQNKDLLETMRLYAAVKQEIGNSAMGIEKYLTLARCEYLMGITFRAENRNNEAAAFFEQGIVWAEESICIQPTSEGYLLLGSGISFLCEIKRSYGLRNHGKIEENAHKALALYPDNIMAQYLIASFYIVAPWPVADVRKGTAILGEILNQNYMALNKDDLFNLYLMLQVACLKQKKNREAQIWRDRGAALYPSNNFISLLVK